MSFSRLHLGLGLIGLILAAPFVGTQPFTAAAQGNTVNGFVFGLENRRLSDTYVELLDELHRTIARSRTDGSGFYSFDGVGAGNMTVRVTPFNSMYEEQESVVEIKSQFTLTGVGGYSIYQKDFFLKLRRGVDPQAAAIFVQEIPKDARLHYERALDDLHHKRNKEGQAALRTALDVFPRYYDALILLGNEYIRMNSPEGYQAASILLSNALDINPRSFEGWYGLAYSLYSERKFTPALTAVRKALELNALSADGQILFGVLSRRQRNFGDAEKALLKANDLSGGRIPRVHWELASLYGNDLKRYADAVRELKLYLKLADSSVNTESIKKLIVDLEAKARRPV